MKERRTSREWEPEFGKHRENEWPDEEETGEDEFDDRFYDEESDDDRYETYLEKKYRKTLWER